MVLPIDANQPFTYAEGREAGLSHRELQGRGFRLVLRGVYIAAEIPDTLVVRCRAASRLLPPDAVFSDITAARLWGGPVPDDPKVHVAFDRPVRIRTSGVKVHRFTYPIIKTRRRHGLPVTSPEQTLLHLTRRLDLVDLVACGDQLSRRGVTTPEELRAAAAAWGGQGTSVLTAASWMMRDRSESVPETRVRLLMVFAGLPEPTANLPIRRSDGSVEYRLDLAYEEQMLAIEYDGRWHDDPEQQLRDRARRTALTERGWHLHIVRAADLYERPEETLLGLWEVCREHGVPVPSVLSDAWRVHFAVRGLGA